LRPKSSTIKGVEKQALSIEGPLLYSCAVQVINLPYVFGLEGPQMAKKVTEYKISTGAERDHFIETVAGDLDFIKTTWSDQPTKALARVYASLLRRLLVERMYEAAWSFMKFADVPKITACDLDESIRKIDPKFIHYAYAGGAPTRPAHFTNFALIVIPSSNLTPEEQLEKAEQIDRQQFHKVKRDFQIGEFYTSSSVVTGDARTSREGIIRYVSNKIGGVHWDNKRREWHDPVGSRHRVLDEGHVRVAPLDVPLYEVVSIAHALVSSSDTEKFLDECQKEMSPGLANWDEVSFREGRVVELKTMKFNSRE
jgi:hypothetical protein